MEIPNLNLELIVDLIAERVAEKVMSRLTPPPQEEYTYSGIAGIMEIFHCSRTKAQELKSSGLLDAAIIKNGRKFVIDRNKALRCIGERKRAR